MKSSMLNSEYSEYGYYASQLDLLEFYFNFDKDGHDSESQRTLISCKNMVKDFFGNFYVNMEKRKNEMIEKGIGEYFHEEYTILINKLFRYIITEKLFLLLGVITEIYRISFGFGSNNDTHVIKFINDVKQSNVKQAKIEEIDKSFSIVILDDIMLNGENSATLSIVEYLLKLDIHVFRNGQLLYYDITNKETPKDSNKDNNIGGADYV